MESAQLNAKETEQFLSKIREGKGHNRNAENINNMKKAFRELEKCPDSNIHLDSLTATLKKTPNWKKTVGGEILTEVKIQRGIFQWPNE